MTNDINVLHFDSILTDLKSGNVKQVFQDLSEHINKLIGTPAQTLFDNFTNLEKQSGSGIGNGIAISHMKLPRLTRPLVIYARLTNMVDFNANDGDPVDMICLVLSPEYEGPVHLQRLSKVTRAFNDKPFCNQLRQANDKEEIRMMLKEINSRKIAA